MRRPLLRNPAHTGHFYRLGHTHRGGSASSARVSPSCFANRISSIPPSRRSPWISLSLCDTNMICVRADARASNRASGASSAGCRLASGSFSTMMSGGRGDSSAADSNR
jgi:hypothetical protein